MTSDGSSPRAPATPAGLVLVGGSGAGKSFVLAHLRRHFHHDPRVGFPVRMTTRPPRPDDRPWENTSVERAHLDALETSGDLLIRWTKQLGPTHAEEYAFAPRSSNPTGRAGCPQPSRRCPPGASSGSRRRTRCASTGATRPAGPRPSATSRCGY